MSRIEPPEPEQIEHGLTVQERAFPGQSYGNRRLSERGRRHVAVRVDTLPVSAESAASSELPHFDGGYARILRLNDGHHAVAGRGDLP
nr:hypothetical protein [Gulosibacter sediminis]